MLQQRRHWRYRLAGMELGARRPPCRKDVAMPLQNRVSPAGDIVADPARGLLTGNRGVLHRPDRTLGRARWRNRAWICCVLDFRGRYHGPMPPGRWTALFFLDEATALAAGHRPCAFCRRADWRRFLRCWATGHRLAAVPRTPDVDRALHQQRVDPGTRRQRCHAWPCADLPDGAIVIDADGVPALILGDRELPWSLTGYGTARPRHRTGEAAVLTPPGTLRTLAAGYRPLLHPTAIAQASATVATAAAAGTK